MLMERLRSDRTIARKARDEVASALLTALVGEAAMVGKNATPPRETDENEAMATVRKFLKNAEETRERLVSAGRDSSIVEREIGLLSAYLPTQMDAIALRAAVLAFRQANTKTL